MACLLASDLASKVPTLPISAKLLKAFLWEHILPGARSRAKQIPCKAIAGLHTLALRPKLERGSVPEPHLLVALSFLRYSDSRSLAWRRQGWEWEGKERNGAEHLSVCFPTPSHSTVHEVQLSMIRANWIPQLEILNYRAGMDLGGHLSGEAERF